MRKVVIIGGGAIGLLTAYYLLDQEFDITIVAHGDIAGDCTGDAAGLVVPNHILRLGALQMVPNGGARRMSLSESPFFNYSGLTEHLRKWCFLFNSFAIGNNGGYTIQELAHLSQLSKELYLQLTETHLFADLGMEKESLLMLYKTEEAARSEDELANLASLHEIKAQVLTRREIQVLEPNLHMNVIGGVLYPGVANPHPKMLAQFLSSYLEQRGVRINQNTRVLDFKTSGHTIQTVQTTAGVLRADFVIVNTGACAGDVAFKLKVPLPAYNGFGFMADNIPAINRSAILVEDRIAVKPQGDTIFFGNTIGFKDSGSIANLSQEDLCTSVRRYYGVINHTLPEKPLLCSGLQKHRPVGVPGMGASQLWGNVLYGNGHMSIAPATGQLLAEHVLNKITASGLSNAFFSDRYC